MVNLKYIVFLCVTIKIIHSCKSDIVSNKTLEIKPNTEWANQVFVATTPHIDINRHDDSSEEDENDNDLAPQTNLEKNSASFHKSNNLALIFNTISNAMINTALRGMKKNDRNIAPDILNDTTAKFQGRQAGPSYIKGDPLNGYYDFVITEGSYKFWVVFQLFTAALLIYSTLAAIYYSKVNPLTSDYDYIDYLSRSFHGRSLDSEDVDMDGDDFTVSKNSYLSSLEHNKWVKTAAYGFQFAMNAIDRIPK